MPAEFFELKREDSINIVELTLPLTIDSKEFEHFNEALSTLFADPSSRLWVLDLSRLSYMGSSALGMMVNVRQQIKSAGGRLVLCGLSPQLAQIFHTCCLERLFNIVKTREEARRQLKRGLG